MTRRNMRLVQTHSSHGHNRANEHNEDSEHLPPKKRQKYMQAVKKDSVHIRSHFEPKSYGQEFYLNALNECDITFCGGPAGTGKTWIATRFALEKLLNHDVERIIVTKPILEAGGESLGFLPGEVEDKVLPHFQSVLDCFEDHLGPTITKKFLDDGQISFLPTAYCRGRTLKNAYIIIDEAQNLTHKGIKLLLTRIGHGSLMAINGDTDQVDLPRPSDSGLQWAIDCLKGSVAEIGIVEMTSADNQRHPLIKEMLSRLN